MEEAQTNIQEKKNYKFYVSVKFPRNAKGYYFGTDDESLKLDDKVVVDNAFGNEIAIIASELHPTSSYKGSLELKAILRKATKDDLTLYEHNIIKAKKSLQIAQEEINLLKLDMNLINASYSLDGGKITITYVSENRVDFRELLKNLAPRLRCRIELRQVGARDRAKAIGGIGLCGLPLCCSTFLNEFDGISISRAKNQLLALNVSKLSGHCGKLICCLLYEDDAYTDAKKEFPEFGTQFKLDGKLYKIVGLNVIAKTIKIQSEEDIQVLPLDEVKKAIGESKHEK